MSGWQYSGPKIGTPPGAQGTSFKVPVKAPTPVADLLGVPSFERRIAALVGGLAQSTVEHEIVRKTKTEPAYVKQYAADDREKAVLVTNRDSFLSRLPPQGLTFFHRAWTFDASVVLASGGAKQSLMSLDPGQSMIITDLRQVWLLAGADAADPDTYQPFTQYMEMNGKVSFNLLVNGAAVFDAKEKLWDVNAGTGVTRNADGFSAIGENLLDIGDHPMAAYVISGDLAGFWSLQATPALLPDAIGVTMNGFLVPTKTLYEVIIAARR